MRVITYNVNGIRAALRRGFAPWLRDCAADVVALQEVRCPVEALPLEAFGQFHVTYDPGRLAGRNGVALLTRQPLANVEAWDERVFTWAPGEVPAPLPVHPAESLDESLAVFGHEGRWLRADLPGTPLTVASLYLPKGGVPAELVKGASRQGRTAEAEQARYERKQSFMAGLARHIDALAKSTADGGRHLLVVGDYNIAHAPADLRNWRANQATDGFLPVERAWLDALVGAASSSQRLPEAARNPQAPAEGRLVDVVRRVHPDQDGPYSWWSWRGQSFAGDVGWRIDYHLAGADLAQTAQRAWVDRAPSYDERVSDHAPVGVDYAV